MPPAAQPWAEWLNPVGIPQTVAAKAGVPLAGADTLPASNRLPPTLPDAPSAPRNAVFPSGDAALSSRNAPFPSRNAPFPIGNATFPIGNATFPTGNATFPSRKMGFRKAKTSKTPVFAVSKEAAAQKATVQTACPGDVAADRQSAAFREIQTAHPAKTPPRPPIRVGRFR
jgi:hypothetical protein